MATTVDICNMALSLIGEDASIVSIDPPDGGDMAGNCARWYPQALRACFEAFDWSWATRRIEPARLASIDEKVYRWKYGYGLPADMVRLISVKGRRSCGPLAFSDFEVESNSSNAAKLLLCNEEEPVVSYVSYTTNASIYPTYFIQCVVLKLASLLVGPVRRSDSQTQAAAGLLQQYAQALSDAKTQDAKASYRSRRPYVASQLRVRAV